MAVNSFWEKASVEVVCELSVYRIRGVCLSRGVLLPLREHQPALSPDSAPMVKVLYNSIYSYRNEAIFLLHSLFQLAQSGA